MLNKYVLFFEEITKWIDEGSPVDIICLDFQKAFDKVPHQRLLLKLKAQDIGDGTIDWIEKWLTDRSSQWGDFKVEISFECSTTRISIRTFIINIYQ